MQRLRSCSCTVRRRDELNRLRGSSREGIGGRIMACSTDGPVSSIEDMIARDSQFYSRGENVDVID